MRKCITKIANTILNPIGISALKSKELVSQIKQYEDLGQLYHQQLQSSATTRDNSCTGVIFSRDRAMQLHALLSSYFELVDSPVPLIVLYYPTDSDHAQSYNEVAELFKNQQIHFVKQQSPSSFRDDLLSLLAGLNSAKIFFLVDDILFVEKINLQTFTALNTNSCVPSLRLGKNLNYCYTVQQEQTLPTWGEAECPPNMMSWSWKKGHCDWGYPLSVDGHLFNLEEIMFMTRMISFSAPNSYEDSLQQFRSVFQMRLGLAYNKAKIINIPWNKVQDENANIAGEIHQEYLLKKWQHGLQIDFRKLYGVQNKSAHQEMELLFCQR